MNDRLRIMQRQPRRISITLSYHVHESLLQRSEEEGRSMSNLCAFLLEDALRHNGIGIISGNGLPASGLHGNGLHGNGIHSSGGNGLHAGQDNRARPRSPF